MHLLYCAYVSLVHGQLGKATGMSCILQVRRLSLAAIPSQGYRKYLLEFQSYGFATLCLSILLGLGVAGTFLRGMVRTDHIMLGGETFGEKGFTCARIQAL